MWIMIRSTAIMIFLAALMVATHAADCHCKEIEPIYTEDCCIGTAGELRTDFGTHCVFRNYSHLGDFNRCCDSYNGIARCVLSPHLSKRGRVAASRRPRS
ncbi:hypothetical protein BX666DRAFT_1962265 [Dichotomocladium elegans]|nr:hypothetical protein BX666DRAFT_1962265 [Dichotomocladium elegans]